MKIVIKVGTSTLTDKNGLLNKKYISELAEKLVALQNGNNKILIVSSGAIGAGQGQLKLKDRPKILREKQALAAVGQPIIMNAYADAFAKYGKTVAQLLLTRDDFDSRVKYINARNTLNELSERGIIPVINENDTVAVDEINFGDNDTLASLVAAAVHADKLVIFTDVDGLYDGHPSKAKLIAKVENITEEIEGFATGKSASGKGTGGMKTKIIAAKIASASGIDTIIANGSKLERLKDIINGTGICTIFPARKCCLEAKKTWIAFSKKPKGNIFVDKKAAEALIVKGKSLLAAGIVKVSGSFKRGDTVAVADVETKKDFARGLVNYDFDDLQKVKGKTTAEMKKIIDVTDDEIIHRDNMVIL
ncbi:MAG: glutamate 5-kinase [Endomicrobia bacterium]|nr:glutamate 5-kinase [Endomicrobiia bacterium]MCL2506297.1 glutamate 5-kinase [Endomicrobiia bacterium]